MRQLRVDRRSVLTGAAVAIPAAALTTSDGAFAAAAPAFEDGRLLALGARIGPMLDAYWSAVERKRAADALAERLCPQPPDILVLRPADRTMFAGCARRETDVRGNAVWPSDFAGADGTVREPRDIFDERLLRGAIANGQINPAQQSESGATVRTLAGIAHLYEARRAAAIERSGLREAARWLSRTASDIEQLAYDIAAIEPMTMEGVAVQARALAAYRGTTLDANGFTGRADDVLGRMLTDAVARLTGAAAGDLREARA